MEDKIISALVGLVGACNNNTKTPNTDSVVIKTLAFPLLCPEYTAADLRETIDSICAEKNVIAPDCAQCQMPCGNTSDYDMGRIYDAEDAVMVTVLEGAGRFTVGGEVFVLHEGETLIMPKDIPHAVFGEEQFKMQLVVSF